MPKKIAIILINYQDYAKKYLADCLESLRKQDYQGEMKIFIVDNQTSEQSFNFLSQYAPEAELILNKTNDGFAKGNNDGIKKALEQNFDYIILFNMDTVVEMNCLSELIRTAEETFLDSRFRGNDDRDIGAVQARIMLYDDKNKINSIGNITHFLGFGYAKGYREKYNPPNPLCQGGEICYPSGAAVLFKAEVLKKVGLFDEHFWMYNEDQDLGWRIWLAGYRCVLAPEAVVYHKYEFNRSIQKYYWLDRNRIIVMLKNYHWATLILILPTFIIMELGLILFSVKTGWFKEKMKVWQYFFKPDSWQYLFKTRHQVQKLRQVKDKEIIKLFSGQIWYQEIGDWKLKLINPFFNLYWRLIKLFIFW